jgi:hypothetical protein
VIGDTSGVTRIGSTSGVDDTRAVENSAGLTATTTTREEMT